MSDIGLTTYDAAAAWLPMWKKKQIELETESK